MVIPKAPNIKRNQKTTPQKLRISFNSNKTCLRTCRSKPNEAEQMNKAQETNPDTVVASKMKQSILQHTTMSSGQNEPIPIEPVRILGVVLHDLIVKNMTHRRTAHGQTRVSGVSFLNRINGQESDRVDGLLNEGSFGGGAQCLGDGSSDDLAAEVGGPGAVDGAGEARWLGGFEAGECGDRERNSVGGGIGAMARDFAGQEGLRKSERGSGSHGCGIGGGLKKWTVRVSVIFRVEMELRASGLHKNGGKRREVAIGLERWRISAVDCG